MDRHHFEFNSMSFYYSLPKEGGCGVTCEKKSCNRPIMKVSFIYFIKARKSDSFVISKIYFLIK